MAYDLTPPTKDFFSHQWYERDGFGMKMITDDLYSRVDSTRRKLNELEIKLVQYLGSERSNPDFCNSWDRIGWLRNYIGIWTSGTMMMPHGKWEAERVYPHSEYLISRWPDGLFGERKEGNILILLSPSVITWLNAVDKWVSELTVASTTTV